MPPIDDDVTVEEIRAETGGTVPVVVDVPVAAPVELPVDPNVLIAADVDIARTEAMTEQARIDARKEIRIAEINAEAPPWLSDLQTSLANMETRLAALETHQSSTPAILNIATTEPAAPVIEVPPASGSAEAMPEPSEAATVEPEGIPPAVGEPPAARKRRWI